MLAFKNGDEGAFVKLYEQHRDRIVNFTRRFLNDTARSEEAAQDVFLKLYQAGPRYQPSSRFSTYLYRIATNHCLNILQRHDSKLIDRRSDLSERHEATQRDPNENTPESVLQQNQIRQTVARAIAQLGEKQRSALILCHYEGMSYREAADIISVTEAAVKSLIHRAKENLATELMPLQLVREVD